MPIEPQYLRIAVDNGRAETIKKLERLFTEFWKLEEPSKILFCNLTSFAQLKHCILCVINYFDPYICKLTRDIFEFPDFLIDILSFQIY